MKDRLLVVGNLAKDVVDGEEKYGGSAANLALAAKHLGLEVGIMSVLGKDEFSKKYRRFLTDNGIDLDLTLGVLAQLPFCQVTSKENVISSSTWNDNGCHPAMDEMIVNKEMFVSYDLIHLVSCPPSLARRIATLDSNLSYEPGPMLIEDPNYFDESVAQASVLIFVNNEEYQVVSGSSEKPLTERVGHDKLIALVVTLGKGGALVYLRNQNSIEAHNIPTPFVADEIIDPTGAGDNFKAGFLAGHMRGRTIPECIQIGSEMGAACIMQKGGILPEERVLEIKDKYNL